MSVNNGWSWQGKQQGSRNDNNCEPLCIVPVEERMEKELAKQYKITAVVVKRRERMGRGMDGKGEGKG